MQDITAGTWGVHVSHFSIGGEVMNITELLLLCILIIGILLFVISRIRSSPPQQTFVPSSVGEEILNDLTAELRSLLQAN
jgi:hypothetical protein